MTPLLKFNDIMHEIWYKNFRSGAFAVLFHYDLKPKMTSGARKDAYISLKMV